MRTSKETARSVLCHPLSGSSDPLPSILGLEETIFLWPVGEGSKSRRDSYAISLAAILVTEFPQQGQILLFLSAFFTLLSQSSQINDHRPTPRMSAMSIAIRVLLKKEMVVHKSARFWPKPPKINIRTCSRWHTGCSYKDV